LDTHAFLDVAVVPLDVNNYRVKYRPRVLTGTEAAGVLESINTASERFATKLNIENDRGIIQLSPPEKREVPTYRNGVGLPAEKNMP